MTQIAGLTPEEARFILQTVRQIRSAGLIDAGYEKRLLRKLPRGVEGGGSGEIRFYVLLGDFTSETAVARLCDKTGTPFDPASPGVTVYRSNGRPAGALAGYWGLFANLSGVWRFLQGPCVDTSCDVGDSFISAGSVPVGNVNEPYTHTITWDELTGNPAISGLPPGLVYDPATGIISGTPTEEGVYTVILTGTSEDNDCPITVAFNLIIEPCDVVDAFIDPDEPPDAEVDEVYTHTILFDDVTITDWGGLPPGITFDPATGALSGTPTQEGSWIVWIEGTATPNGCTIRIEFTLRIIPCDAEDSRLITFGLGIGVGGWTIHLNEPEFSQVFGYRITGDIELYSVQQCCPDPAPCTPSAATLPTGLSYDPTTGILSGVPTIAAECLPTPCYYLLTFRADSETNECDVWLEVPMYYPCLCPSPTDYTTLGAWLVTSGGATSSLSIDVSIPFNETISLSNATIDSVSGVPPGLLWDGTDIDGVPGSPGTYATVFSGTVTSGTHAGCPITHTRTYTVS